MSARARARAHELVRWLLIGGLVLGAVNSAAEAADLLDGAADYLSIGFTVAIHAAAIAGLLTRHRNAKWLALAVFISDTLLALWITAQLPEAATAGHAVAAGHGAATAALFAVATWAWSGDPGD